MKIIRTLTWGGGQSTEGDEGHFYSHKSKFKNVRMMRKKSESEKILISKILTVVKKTSNV